MLFRSGFDASGAVVAAAAVLPDAAGAVSVPSSDGSSCGKKKTITAMTASAAMPRSSFFVLAFITGFDMIKNVLSVRAAERAVRGILYQKIARRAIADGR